jgi:hypothetical protein
LKSSADSVPNRTIVPFAFFGFTSTNVIYFTLVSLKPTKQGDIYDEYENVKFITKGTALGIEVACIPTPLLSLGDDSTI